MTKMNVEQLKRVAQKLFGLLADEKIPTEELSVFVDVPADYLTSIITNFPIRMRSVGDIAVTVSEENWNITVALDIIGMIKPSPVPGSDPLEPKDSGETADAEGGPIDQRWARNTASKIRTIFEEAGLEVAGYQVLVTVPTEFYESIKHHFSQTDLYDLQRLMKWDHYTFGFCHYGDTRPRLKKNRAIDGPSER